MRSLKRCWDGGRFGFVGKSLQKCKAAARPTSTLPKCLQVQIQERIVPDAWPLSAALPGPRTGTDGKHNSFMRHDHVHSDGSWQRDRR